MDSNFLRKLSSDYITILLTTFQKNRAENNSTLNLFSFRFSLARSSGHVYSELDSESISP